MKFGSGLFVCSHMQLGEILKAKAHHGTTLNESFDIRVISRPASQVQRPRHPLATRNWLTAKCREFGSCRTRSFGDTAQHNVSDITNRQCHRYHHINRCQPVKDAIRTPTSSIRTTPKSDIRLNNDRETADYQQNKQVKTSGYTTWLLPGVQSASLIMTSLMTS